jgi:hypothetical protein
MHSVAGEDEQDDSESSADRAARFGERLDALLADGRTVEMCGLAAAAFARRADAADVPEVAALVSALPDAVLTARPRVRPADRSVSEPEWCQGWPDPHRNGMRSQAPCDYSDTCPKPGCQHATIG